MIRLTNPTTDLLRVSASSTNAIQIVVSYSEKTATAYTGKTAVLAKTTTAIETILGTPGASIIDDVDHITFYCAAANTLTPSLTVSGTAYPFGAFALLAGDTLEYTHAHGWKTLDASGQEKFVMPGYLPLTGGTVSGATTFSALLTASANIALNAGTVGLPSLYLGGDTTSGPYRIGANNIGVAIGGAKVLDVSATGLGITGTLTVSENAALNGANLTTTAATVTAFAGATTLLTLGGTGATSVVAIPGTKLSLAATMDAWGTTRRIFRIGSGASLVGYESTTFPDSVWFGCNNYVSSDNSTEKRIGTGYASKLQLFQGVWSFKYAASGAADSTITWADGLTISTTGAVVVPNTLSVTGTMDVSQEIQAVKDVRFTEMTAPTGTANTAKVFAVDNGAGKTVLKVIFGSGAAIVIATEL